MSEIGGMLNFGTPAPAIDLTLLNEIGNRLESYGTDGGRDIAFGNLGMSYRAFHTTPQSHSEAQPIVTAHGHVLAWNGRLDNREEMIHQLHADLQRGPQTITDVGIVMAAYMKWGKDSFARLIGDFCLSLWDKRLRLLYLVRDAIGTRALYFHIDKNRVCWSTHLSPLLELFEIDLEIEDEYIAGLLVRVPEPGLTPYKHIHAVKPAHVITVSQTGEISERRFWGLDTNKKIRYHDPDQYVEQFIHEFSGAVKCRLRSDRPVFAELSGGLDSSSIVCMADRLIANGEVQTTVETVSQVFDESPTSDERKFIVLVEDQRGVTGHHIREEDYPFLAPLPDHIDIVTPNPVLNSYQALVGMCHAMRMRGARVVLSGQGGDELLGSNYSAYPDVADYLVSLHPLQLHRRLQNWSRALKRPYLELLWKNALVPTLPRKLQTVLKRGPRPNIPDWFNTAFVKRLNLRERNLGTKDIFGFRLPSERDQSAGFISLVKSISLNCRQEQANIEVSYPYLHRPLVEFLQAIPFEQLLRPGLNRCLMRSGMRGILPDRIVERKTKGNPHEVLTRALAHEWGALHKMFEEARVCAFGYMEQGPLLTAINRAKHGCEPMSSALLPTISLELWLRAIERRRTARRTQPDSSAVHRALLGREIVCPAGLTS